MKVFQTIFILTFQHFVAIIMNLCFKQKKMNKFANLPFKSNLFALRCTVRNNEEEKLMKNCTL